jgi:hypothetical protein
MLIKLSQTPVRDVTAISFSDITPVEIVGYPVDEHGDMSIEFASDLTPVQARRVVMRAAATDIEQQIQDRALAAYQANQAFLALASPTNAQVLAQVKVLSKECNGLLRLVFGMNDSADGV